MMTAATLSRIRKAWLWQRLTAAADCEHRQDCVMLSGSRSQLYKALALRELGADPSGDCSGVGDRGRNWPMELSV
jgi:hypothetical protein